VLDVACGKGRNALFLARSGWSVHAVDRDADALARLDRLVTTEVVDLESGTPALGHREYGAVIVFNYLHRPLMPAIVEAVAPGGVLIYETFTAGQRARGHPRNPAFLLREGELPTLVAPLDVVRSREGEFDGKLVASLVAVRRSRSAER
jgi:SAM-dependent methyltransferase